MLLVNTATLVTKFPQVGFGDTLKPWYIDQDMNSTAGVFVYFLHGSVFAASHSSWSNIAVSKYLVNE